MHFSLSATQLVLVISLLAIVNVPLAHAAPRGGRGGHSGGGHSGPAAPKLNPPNLPPKAHAQPAHHTDTLPKPPANTPAPAALPVSKPSNRPAPPSRPTPPTSKSPGNTPAPPASKTPGHTPAQPSKPAVSELPASKAKGETPNAPGQPQATSKGGFHLPGLSGIHNPFGSGTTTTSVGVIGYPTMTPSWGQGTTRTGPATGVTATNPTTMVTTVVKPSDVGGACSVDPEEG